MTTVKELKSSAKGLPAQAGGSTSGGKTSHLKPGEVRVRLAPSPTGPFHIGTARTALFNWLFARQGGGKFILRIEDTDKERSDKKWEKEIIDGLKWLGLDWDEGPVYADERGFANGETRINADNKISVNQRSNPRESAYKGQYAPYRQSERGEIYKKYLEKLLSGGHAYYCYCTKEDLEAERQAMMAQGMPAKYGGHCRNLPPAGGEPPMGKTPQVIRFKTPEAEVEFKDIIRGNVKFDAALFGDMVIAKDLNTPLYNFAAVIDDEEMGITHVIRGEDHLSNTPKQILIQKALGFGELEYAHLPLILNSDRSKLSKRYTETSFLDYKTQGYLPEAMINFLALLGWHSKEDKEFLTKEDLIKEFDLRRVQKAGAIFNVEKLDWLQKEHLKRKNNEELVEYYYPILKNKDLKITKEFLKKLIEKWRDHFISDFRERPELLEFLIKLPAYRFTMLMPPENKNKGWVLEVTPGKIKGALENVLNIVSGIDDINFKKEFIVISLTDILNREGRGNVLWPLRVALSGQTISPDPLEIMEVLGKDESIRRINIAIEKLKN